METANTGDILTVRERVTCKLSLLRNNYTSLFICFITGFENWMTASHLKLTFSLSESLMLIY